MSQSSVSAVAEFLDETPGSHWKIENPERTNLSDRQPEIELAKYLKRPVLIKTHVWAQTDNFGPTATWDPWFLFFDSAPIKNKIQNYNFISCTLKLKFVVNASPFYSGAMAFTYCPLQGVNGNSIIHDAGNLESVPYSQRPKVWVFPQTNQGGEIDLPFFYHKNWLDLTTAVDVHNMGTVTPYVYSPLLSANGVAGTSIVVHVFAWAEDIKLHAPTLKAALQSDEFDYKPSQIASSVAQSVGKLSRIPLIGPYMKATSVVAQGVSSIASALGFTNVPNMDTVNAFKAQPFPHNSTCDISVPCDRGTVDPKNEVTIDPRTVGLDGTDELSISHIAGRESFIGNVLFNTANTVDGLLMATRVTPAILYQQSSVLPKQYTPAGYLSEMFRYWRGDMIFRFKFICTRFHKGRVRISFDPTHNIITNVPDYTTIFNEIVDIGADQDLEIRVPYMQATTFLRVNCIPGNAALSGVGLTPDAFSNGLLTMRVVNPLTGPQAVDAIHIMVFVRAADNLEFAWPHLQTTDSVGLSPYTLQSREVEYPVAPVQVIAGNNINAGDPEKNNIHFGEYVTSLRPLLHRLYFQYALRFQTVASTDTLTIAQHITSRRLKYNGFDTLGPFTANKVVGVGTAPYMYNKMNIPQLVSLMFVGQRGSITWSYNLESTINSNPPANVTAKWYGKGVNANDFEISNATTSTSQNTIAFIMQDVFKDYNSGVALTDQRNQPGIVMNYPYYSNYNFQFTNPTFALQGSTSDGTDFDNTILQVVCQQPSASYNMRVNTWASLGPDYNFFFFLNAPSLYSYTTPAGV